MESLIAMSTLIAHLTERRLAQPREMSGQGWPGLVSKLQARTQPISRPHVITTLASTALPSSEQCFRIIALIANELCRGGSVNALPDVTPGIGKSDKMKRTSASHVDQEKRYQTVAQDHRELLHRMVEPNDRIQALRQSITHSPEVIPHVWFDSRNRPSASQGPPSFPPRPKCGRHPAVLHFGLATHP